MRFNIEEKEPRVKRLSRWHEWFAWHPVRVDHDTIVWLERIYRCGKYSMDSGGGSWNWSYSDNPDVLN